MSQSERNFFEPRFGADFSGVRIHEGTRAGDLAQNIHARAFTLGRDVFLGEGHYVAGSSEGKRLMAHELTHTIQQKWINTIQRKEPQETSTPPQSTSPPAEDKRIKCYIFLYDVSDTKFKSVWQKSAEFFANSQDGLALEGGSSTADTMKKVVDAYNAKKEKYRCIKAIEFLGHGSPGSAFLGKFSAKDFAADKALRAAQKAGAEAAEPESGAESDVVKNTELHTQFQALKGLLCSESYFHFRTCNTLKGPGDVNKCSGPSCSPSTTKPGGEEFGKMLATEFGTYVIGHSEFVDTLLPGRKVFGPGGSKIAAVPESLIPERKAPSELAFQDYLLTVSVDNLQVPILGTISKELKIYGKILVDPNDSNNYLFELELKEPSLLYLREIVPMMIKLLPSTDISPTVKALNEHLAKSNNGGSVKVPIDRQIIERFKRSNAVLAFSLPTKGGDSITIKLEGIKSGQSWVEKRGGLEMGTDIGVGVPREGPSMFQARIFAGLPVYDYRTFFRISTELGVTFGYPDTAMLEAYVPFQLRFGGLIEALTSKKIDPYLAFAPYVGAGWYQGGFSGSGGLQTRIGVALGEDFDIAALWGVGGTRQGLTNEFALRLGWIF